MEYLTFALATALAAAPVPIYVGPNVRGGFVDVDQGGLDSIEDLRQELRGNPSLRVVAEAGIERSLGSIGDSYDNALAESVMGLFKTEVIRRVWPWRNTDAVEFAVLRWVDWFNNRRLLEPLDYVPPVEYETAYYRAQSTPAAMAGLN